MHVTTVVLALTLHAAEGSERHVRSVEPRLVALVERGLSRSETFRRIVATLEQSDVFVLIESKVIPQRFKGYLLHHVVTAGNRRYLRIVVGATGRDDDLVRVIAHELQHACEVAQAPHVRDEAAMDALFGRIGLCPGCVIPVQETSGAQRIEELVGRELKAHSGSHQHR